jgi:hypothetical protein
MDELPKLRSLSDVLWGFWNRDNDDIQGLRIYGALWIANDDTRKLAASALASRNRDKLDRWPGLQFGRHAGGKGTAWFSNRRDHRLLPDAA